MLPIRAQLVSACVNVAAFLRRPPAFVAATTLVIFVGIAIAPRVAPARPTPPLGVAVESMVCAGSRPLGDTLGLLPMSLHPAVDALRHRPSRAKVKRVSPAGPPTRDDHPREHAAAIRYASKRTKLPASLLFALVREESRFEESAVSARDAHGLVQLRWDTARELAEELGVELETRDELHDPFLNVLLGARYLARLVAKHGNRFAPALAAYYVGPRKVARWLRACGVNGDDPVSDAAIVAAIPSVQVRGYVRRVLDAYAAYRSLYERSPSSSRRVCKVKKLG